MPTIPRTETDRYPDAIRDEWVSRLNLLVGEIETWARSLDWEARRVEKPMKDSVVGPYQAPGLLLQKEFKRILLDPISRSTPGSDGLVDLYLMPALDDITSFYFSEGRWYVHNPFDDDEARASDRDAQAKPLIKETFAEILERLDRHAA